MVQILSRALPIILICLLIKLPAQEIIWSDPIPVATSAFGFSRPRVVTNGNGDPVFLWSHEAPHKIYLNQFIQGQMTTPMQINPLGTQYFGASWAGPELAASGHDIYVVGKEQPEHETGVSFFHSSDGGVTFAEYNNVDWSLGDDLSRFPDVAAGPNGEVWVAFMRFEPDFSQARYVVSKSLNYGASFEVDVNASSEIIEGYACDCCAAQLAVSGNQLAMIYRNNDQNVRTIWAGISEDGGDSFNAGYEIDETGSYFASCPATAPDGYWAGNRLISTFRAAPGGRERVFFSVFDLDSQKVVLHQYLTNSPDMLLAQNHPRITGNQDTVLLIWEESYAGNLDIKYRFSTTGPEGLVTAETNVLNLSTSGNQLRPDVHFANGKLHAVYQDVIANLVIYVQGEVEGVSKAEDNPSATSFGLIPNPTTGWVNFGEQPGLERLVVLDLYGHVIRQFPAANGQTQIDLSVLFPGMYYLVFYSSSATPITVKRMIKIGS